MRFVLFALSIIVATTVLNTPTKAQTIRGARLQRWGGRGRYKLRFHNISTMHGHGARAWPLLPTEHTIPASTRIISIS
jgi:hypothetical protein